MNIQKKLNNLQFKYVFFAAKKNGLYFGHRLYFGLWKSIPSSNFYTSVANILKKVLHNPI